MLSKEKEVDLGYIRTILLRRLKLLKTGISHIHSEAKPIKSQRDRRLRTLYSTPFCERLPFIKLFLSLSLSPE